MNVVESPVCRLSDAIGVWQEVLGQDRVILDVGACHEAETATFATNQSIPVILRPTNREQVQACMRAANRFGVPVYPVSRGKNWGYGSRVPPADAALMDLSEMNRILDWNEDLAYVTVEPGVTQQQLYDFLRERKSNLWIDATGSSPDASIIGNALERGFGHTPYSDHFGHICGLEVVLPDGESIETGFARFDGAKAASVARYGAGPFIDGLFSQSNFGVVTRASVWLMPAPEACSAFFFQCDAERMASVIDALRPLRLHGTLRSAIHIGNDFKVLSGMQQYPWSLTNGATPLPREALRRLAEKLHFSPWNGAGALYGTRAQVREARRLVRKALRKYTSRLNFVDDRLLSIAELCSKPIRRLTGIDIARPVSLARSVFNLMRGVPSTHPLHSLYWRKTSPIPKDIDPDRDGCGLMWCSPIAPAEGHHAEAVAAIADRIIYEYGFEPMISITLVGERFLACVITIAYDRAVEGDDERALRCSRELRQALADSGYYPYRLGIQSMDTAYSNGPFNDTVRTLKRALDPNDILAPGRYCAPLAQSTEAIVGKSA